MSIETDTSDADAAEATVDDLATELGEAITELPAYETFRETKDAVEADEEAQEKITEFEQIRDEFMVARQTGQASQEDLKELQAAQEELHSLPVMEEYLQAKNEVELKLQELNELVSEPLAMDFSDAASGCCQDE
ncbi:YlbF family regulator [Haloarculaceae archaeon H-GB2-1]|nr:YlbF family regulator [Haloarculaceae archaeon H-GB1-1]MEA5386231.1 YlbF family regulator [Haloarculaceae archaeon H-GB11]MEA5407732.1 YlbF family regulator [Haloarculaceae archaeon H-GB2-1]